MEQSEYLAEQIAKAIRETLVVENKQSIPLAVKKIAVVVESLLNNEQSVKASVI